MKFFQNFRLFGKIKKLRKLHIVLISIAVLVLIGSIGTMTYLLYSNYQNATLFKQAQRNFQRGDEASLDAAKAQLLQLIKNDDDNEAAYVMLGAIAEKRKIYPEQVYYCFMAYKLNPLSTENKDKYISSLCSARDFERLENFLSRQSDISDKQNQILVYAAGQNGRIQKYKNVSKAGSSLNKLTELLFRKKLTTAEKLKKLSVFKEDDPFLKQEILAAQARFYLEVRDVEKTEKALQAAYELNPYAFAPSLGRFYINFRSFGQGLEVFEKYLETYHDQAVALQTAEVYCLLKQTGKIEKLRKEYQSDSGNSAMLSCYYFDALTALAKNEQSSLKKFTMPLRKNINTPLAAFMFLCVDIEDGDLNAVRQSYNNLLSHRTYLDLQDRADGMILNLIKRFWNESEKKDQILSLAEIVYRRKPDVMVAKLILLSQKQKDSIDIILLQDALKRFQDDPGMIKIGIEYYLNNDLTAAGKLIAKYRELYPAKQSDMLRYEIISALRRKNYELASKLFRDNFSPEICPEYWTFASSSMREKDLEFLSRNKTYAPYCQALILLKKNNAKAACDLLERAEYNENQALLFFAAKTLAENGRNQAALKKYSLFPEKTPYKLSVLLNTAEIHAESGNLSYALQLAAAAYKMSPDRPEPQLCYADKLYKNGKVSVIPDIIKLSSDTPYRKEMRKLWIAGMQQRIKDCDHQRQRERARELCRQLLVVDPENQTSLECIKKLNKMPQ